MNSSCITFAPESKLKALPTIVKKAIEYNFGKIHRPCTPRRLLLGAYLLFRNEQLKNKQLQSSIDYLNGVLQKQHERINALVDYEKQVIYDGYSAELIYYSWRCGDGCCSDSWYGYRILNKDNVCERNVGGGSSSTYLSRERAKEEIQDIIGSKALITEHTEDV